MHRRLAHGTPRKRRFYSKLVSKLEGRIPSMMRSAETGKMLSVKASQRMPKHEQYIDFVLSRPRIKGQRKEYIVDVLKKIRMVAPHAKVTLIDDPHVPSMFQDMRITGISAGQALTLTGVLGTEGPFPKYA